MLHELAPLAQLDERARRAVEFARRRAESARSTVIGPEHVLLALLAVRRGLAARAVARVSGSCMDAEGAIAAGLVPGSRPSPVHIPFTAGCEAAIVRAAQQARQMGDDRIGTEHLLLGLLLAIEEPPVRRLADLGIDYETVRAAVGRLRGGPA